MLSVRLRCAINCVALVLLLSGALLTQTAPASAGILDAAWIAPTTNTDGSPLTDLSSYRMYYGAAQSPCPGSSFFSVASPTSSPTSNQSVNGRLTGLATGTLYHVAVTAVDTNGNESPCSSSASAVARAEFDVSPTGTVNFGSVNLGSSTDRTFTVSNKAGGTVSGSAAVAPPFTIVSGSSFTLSGLGATQAVTVRFTPTTTTTVSATVSFSASGATVTRIVTGGTGVGTGTDTVRPSISITSPTSGTPYTTKSASLTLQGTAADNVGVTLVAWTNSRGGSGTAIGTTGWTANGIVLQPGSNVLTVTALDAAGNAGTATLSVTYDNPNGAPGIPLPPVPTIPTPSAGLVAAYSFSEGAGGVVADASGNNNTGTISGAAWTTGGRFGNALVFDGATAVVTIPNAASLQLTTGMTLEAWVYPTATPEGWRAVIDKNTDSYYLMASSNHNVPAVGATWTAGNRNLYAGGVLPVAEWTHLAATFDGTTVRLFVNAVEVARETQTTPLTTSADTLQIGGDAYTGENFAGVIDEVRIYNRALSAAEIQADMNTAVGATPASPPPPPPAPQPPDPPSPIPPSPTSPAGLVAAYSFAEGEGSGVADASGNNNTGTISGAVWTTAGRFGNALGFDGSDAVVTIPDATSLQLTTGMTLEAWVYPSATSEGWRSIIDKNTDRYYLMASSDQNVPAAGATWTAGNRNLYAGGGLPVGAWTHLAATFDGTTARLYVNGVEVASEQQTTPLTSSTGTLQIGGNAYAGENFAGLIDEVRIYNRALSEAEIRADMNTPVAGP